MTILRNTHGFDFPLKDFSAAELPPKAQIIAAAHEFVTQIKIDWTKTKVYPHDVHTYTTRQGNDFWMSRISYHTDVTFDQFKSAILEDHTRNEVKYIPLLDSARDHEDEPDVIPEDHPDGWKAFTVHYKFPRLFSDREMAVWVLAVQPDPEIKQFIIISVPSSHAVSPHVTRAEYLAIEVVTYIEEEGHVEWIMAQTSDAKGNIPRWIQDKSVTASVVADVPSFIDWAKKNLQ
ncbi:hypothetical protein DV495_001428 [Geotrichum candidum]|uniref:DUF3074 domain-containing protein n=1 Tax=Geotrichum candidum TaxID=1173061 RepID=A0A0J9X9Y2_GEOCN|nr:hypothetical protein DV452_000685 [Geotrichum candidum]KAF5132331.1 hypothetical protein DV495_001428 [Geotrichum candidum]KAI8134755.1 hypothetical protein DUD61_001540 [Geotrichum candidum]KAI9212205.1 hypothetical protein DS838_002907 [Geotrichum bryndzae]CDO53990.1 conserved hypothetical protein [Geotrichum candidum]